MPIFEWDLIPSPAGMAPSQDAASLDTTQCRLLEGMLPARLGVQRTAPLPKRLVTVIPRNAGEQIQGYAIYKCQHPEFPLTDLLIFTDRNLYVLPIWGSNEIGASFSGFDYCFYQYDGPRAPGGHQRAHIQYMQMPFGIENAPNVGGFVTSDWAADASAGTYNNIATTQFDNELLFSVNGSVADSPNQLWRYYRDITGAQHLYALYIPKGGAPTISATSSPGTLSGTYAYVWTWVDTLGNESKVSDSVTIGPVGTSVLTVTRGATLGTGTNPFASWNLYRTISGPGVNFFLVANIPVGTLQYADSTPDATLITHTPLPPITATDPPRGGPASVSAGMALSGIYQYAWTWLDELGRESSPSDTLTTPVLSFQNVTIVRGSTTTGTSIAVNAGSWNLYRRNPGSDTYNLVANIPFGTTTYVDNIPDATVSLSDVMPDFGVNDPPDFATYLTVHKGRVVLNDASTFGVVQIGNAGSATQFSSILNPTTTTAGMRLAPGNDADNLITGLESIGDLLWIAKPNTYYLLQGDDITNWNVQQVGKNRGSDNPFTVQRTEELVMFKSVDGMYGLSYQAGMVSPKMSWEIDGLMNAFSSVLTPNDPQPFGGVFTPAASDGNTTGQPISTEAAGRYTDFVRSFYWQQHYFLCLMDRTLVFDGLMKGWGDTGWGPVKWPVVYDGMAPRNILGLPTASLPETAFFSHGGAYSGDLDVWYFTSADTPIDVDAATTYPRPFVGREVTRNFKRVHLFSGQGPAQTVQIRGAYLTIWGKSGKRKGTRLGWIQAYADGRKVGPRLPIVYGTTVRTPVPNENILYQIAMPPTMQGYELYFSIEWTTSDVEVGNRRFDYVNVEHQAGR